MNPPAGWYADPVSSGTVRYWDGTEWTEHTAPHQPAPAGSSPFAALGSQAAGGQTAGYQTAGYQTAGYGIASPTADGQTSYRDPSGYVPMQSQSYASPQYVVAVPPRNSKATRALVWGIICVIINPFALPSILAFVFGVQSRTTAAEMERAGLVDSGRGRATAGIVLGSIGAAFFVLWMVFYVSQAIIPRLNG